MARRTTIASLAIGISANTRRLRRQLRRTVRRIRRFASTIQRSLIRAFSFAGLGALGAGGVFAGILSRINDIDRRAKTAFKFNVPSRDLDALNFSLEKAGVNTRTVGTFLQRVTRRVQEAAQGRGEAFPALEELGANAKELAKLNPIEIVDRLSRLLNDAPKETRFRLAFRLADTEGVDFLTKGLSSLVDGAQRRLQNFEKAQGGVSLRDDQLVQIQKLRDLFTDVSTRVSGLADQIVAKLTPSIGAAAKGLFGLLGDLREFTDAITAKDVREFEESLKRAFLEAKKSFSSLLDDVGGFQRTLRAVGDSLQFIANQANVLIDVFRSVQRVVEGAFSSIDRILKAPIQAVVDNVPSDDQRIAGRAVEAQGSFLAAPLSGALDALKSFARGDELSAVADAFTDSFTSRIEDGAREVLSVADGLRTGALPALRAERQKLSDTVSRVAESRITNTPTARNNSVARFSEGQGFVLNTSLTRRRRLESRASDFSRGEGFIRNTSSGRDVRPEPREERTRTDSRFQRDSLRALQAIVGNTEPRDSTPRFQ